MPEVRKQPMPSLFKDKNDEGKVEKPPGNFPVALDAKSIILETFKSYAGPKSLEKKRK